MILILPEAALFGDFCYIKHIDMEINHPQTQPVQISRRALRLFAVGASIVFIGALIYCYLTEHFFEVGLLSAAMALLGGLTYWIYKGLDH